MADNAILFKYLTKRIGMQRGVIPSFMAKPWNNVSHLDISIESISNVTHSFPAVAGMNPLHLLHLPPFNRPDSHIHVSLRNNQNQNIFALPSSDVGREGAAFEDTKCISEAAEHFLAGILDGVADSQFTINYQSFHVY